VLSTIAIENYRSLRRAVLPLGRLNLITGPNGSGKSNLYRALRLLAETGGRGVVRALALEGGLKSALWAGPPQAYRGKKKPVRLRLGFAGEDFGYAISIGLPPPPGPHSATAFALDPEIKRECIWAGPFYRPASTLVDRNGPVISVRSDVGWDMLRKNVDDHDSLFDQLADPRATPEVFSLREVIRQWRFYDHFRTDRDAPARSFQLATRTPVLSPDGRDLAAALQTIREIGDYEALDRAVDDAFPGARLSTPGGNRIEFQQDGLIRPLSAAELSDGTLRYLLWIAALLTPRPPLMMVLNEPETSLHPDLLPALARLIAQASALTQVWVVSHAAVLIDALESTEDCRSIRLEKAHGATRIVGQRLIDEPAWHWPD
jgi:predicted ATPase